MSISIGSAFSKVQELEQKLQEVTERLEKLEEIQASMIKPLMEPIEVVGSWCKTEQKDFITRGNSE